MKRTISLTFLSLALLSFRGLSQTNVTTLSKPNSAERGAAYLQLNRQIYARHEDQSSGNLSDVPDKANSLERQLQNMIAEEIDRVLADPKVSAASIASSISKLQGEMSLTSWDPEATNTPFANFFQLNGAHTLALAYVIMQGGDAIPDAQPYLKFYDKISGSWQEKAVAPTLSDFGGCTFSLAKLNSGLPSEAWFLAWGGPIGSTRASQKVRLYAFDGFTVRTIWKRDWLDAGKIAVTPDTIMLDYLDRDDMSIEKHEVLHVGPNGLQ